MKNSMLVLSVGVAVILVVSGCKGLGTSADLKEQMTFQNGEEWITLEVDDFDRKLTNLPVPACSMLLHPDGQRLVVVGPTDRGVYLYDLNDGKVSTLIEDGDGLTGCRGWLMPMAIDAKSNQLWIARGKAVKMYALDTMAEAGSHEVAESVSAMALGTKYLFVGGLNGEVATYDRESFELVRRDQVFPPGSKIIDVEAVPNPQGFALSEDDDTGGWGNGASGEEDPGGSGETTPDTQPQSQPASSGAQVGREGWYAAATTSGEVRVARMFYRKSGERLIDNIKFYDERKKQWEIQIGWVTSMVFSPSGEKLFVAGARYNQVWSARLDQITGLDKSNGLPADMDGRDIGFLNMGLKRQSDRPLAMVRNIELMKNSNRLAAPSTNNVVRFWDWRQGKLLYIVRMPMTYAEISSIVLGHDDGFLVAGTEDGSLFWKDLTKSKPLQ